MLFRSDWDQHVKTTGRIIRLDDAGKTVTAFADSDKKEHLVRLTPHTEFFVHGAWGTAADFVPGQRIYLIVLTDDQKEWTTAHTMADEISMQAMSRPFVLKQYAEHDHKLLFTDEKERKAPADLITNAQTHFAVLNHEPLQSGQAYYFNSREQNNTHLAMAVLDAGSFDAERRTRLKQQRDLAAENGLVATILEVDEPNHQVALLVRRADAWYARLLKINDHVAVKSADRQSAGSQFTVADVRPDYARMRVRLEAGSSEMAQFRRGEEVRLLMKIPEAVDPEMPPDLGRFIERQERIDYFLSTVYCSCGMMGTSCAGHWNTLAACKLHGCGMPNLMTKLLGDWIDSGKNDGEIMEALIKREGKIALRPHQN